MINTFSLSQGAAIELPFLLALIAIGGIVFAWVATAFRGAQIFGSASRTVVATCVAILAVLGLVYPPPTSKGPPDAGVPSPWEPIIRATMLPYAALAITLIGLFLLIAMVKVRAWIRGRFEALRVSRSKRLSAIKSCRRTCVRGESDERRHKKRNPLEKWTQDDAD